MKIGVIKAPLNITYEENTKRLYNKKSHKKTTKVKNYFSAILISFSHKARKAQRVRKPNKSVVSWCLCASFLTKKIHI